MTRRVMTATAAAVFALPLTLLAQTSPQGPPTITVTGQAVATAAPDRAEMDLGVVTRAETSREASTRNAQAAERVVERLRRSLGAGSMVRSLSFSIRPEYSPPRDGQEPAITGYTATNIVRVKMSEVTKVGEVIDAATAAGANRIDRVRFLLSDESAVRTNALRDAARQARSQADALASALGVRILRVLSASEASQPVRPFVDVQARSLAAEAAATPIDAGPIEVSASVSLTVEISAAPPP